MYDKLIDKAFLFPAISISLVVLLLLWYFRYLRHKTLIWAWGLNNYGELGNGTTGSRASPVLVANQDVVIAIAAGKFHSLALKGNNTVWAWGYNDSGQLGVDNASTDNSSTPIQVSGLDDVLTITAGLNHSIALKKPNGTVWAWGKNDSGQLGVDNVSTPYSSTPLQVSGLEGVNAVACGNNHTAALKGDGTVWAWGNNDQGQLGVDNVNTPYSFTPVQVKTVNGEDLVDVKAIACGAKYTVALKGDGTVWTWGRNMESQLGDGTTDNISPSPVQVVDETGTAPLTGIADIAAGEAHTLAVQILSSATGSTVFGWGSFGNGQIGPNGAWNIQHPVQISGPSNMSVSKVAAGGNHSMAL